MRTPEAQSLIHQLTAVADCRSQVTDSDTSAAPGMADSKHVDMGQLAAAMSYRVKYRKQAAESKNTKMVLRVESLGVHKKNRGGIYPSGARCLSLATEVITAGFLKEETQHACVAVEEVPLDSVMSALGPQHGNCAPTSLASYNATQSAKDDILADCFKQPYDDVRHGLLSHNHMMLVMRAFLTGAKWNIPPSKDKGIVFCGEDGKLSLTAVAAHPNAQEMQELLTEGIPCEVLSWKMDVEEPDAADLISAALNSPHQMAMRTTELTAISVLKGEIIAQSKLSEEVAFQTVVERVRQRLQCAADDPDLPEVFDWLISTGVGNNGYIDQLLEWTGVFVDGRLRQLRFSAFAVINKMCENGVWTKMAVLKRAYRSNATNGFCPSPEKEWGDVKWAHLKSLEELLRFFHVTCKEFMQNIEARKRIRLLGNIDCQISTSFMAQYKLKKPQVAIQKALIECASTACQKDNINPLEFHEIPAMNSMAMNSIPDWINFKKDEGTPGTPAVAASAPEDSTDDKPVSARVIRFDEVTGLMLNYQKDFPKAESADNKDKDKDKDKKQVIPWREWMQKLRGLRNNEKESDRATAVAALDYMHASKEVADEPIEIYATSRGEGVIGTPFVKTTAVVPRFTVNLPCCIPKSNRVHDNSEHPLNVEVKVRVMADANTHEDGTTEGGDARGSTNQVRASRFWIHPEFSAPKLKKTTDTAAGQPATGQPAPTAVAEWEWEPTTAYSMHPFWAVRKLTAAQLKKEQIDVGFSNTGQCEEERRPVPRFNCVYQTRQVSCVNVIPGPGSVQRNLRIVEVPYITNSVDLAEGDELILQVFEKVKKDDKKRRWLDEHKDKSKKAKTTAGKTPSQG